MTSDNITGNVSSDHIKSTWDSFRLVREYMKVAWMANDSVPYNQLPLGNQVRLQRVASVICAYLNEQYVESKTFEVINSVFDCYDINEVLGTSPISDDNLALLKQMLCEASSEEWKTEHLLTKFNLEKDRVQLMRMLVRYRVATEDLLGTFSGVMEARVGGYLGMQTVKAIYNPVLDACNKKIDKMIVILLGNKFNKSFSERELIEQFNYPTMTDSELIDWEVDNF